MIKEFQREYRWLSNFSPVKIEYEGRVFPSVEHAYMSAKSNDEDWKELCAYGGLTPGAIKRRSYTISLRSDWTAVKLEVMEVLTRKKYENPIYRKNLIATGNKHIQEGNKWGDTFWGVSLHNGRGQNNLGKIIMKIRDELRETE